MKNRERERGSVSKIVNIFSERAKE
jgi:hypothetical protein